MNFRLLIKKRGLLFEPKTRQGVTKLVSLWADELNFVRRGTNYQVD